MTPETFNAISKGIFNLLLMTMQTISLIIGLAAIVGFAMYLISIAWFCFLETGRSVPRQKRRLHSVPEPPEPDEYDLLVTLVCLDDNGAAETMCRERAVMQNV